MKKNSHYLCSLLTVNGSLLFILLKRNLEIMSFMKLERNGLKNLLMVRKLIKLFPPTSVRRLTGTQELLTQLYETLSLSSKSVSRLTFDLDSVEDLQKFLLSLGCLRKSEVLIFKSTRGFHVLILSTNPKEVPLIDDPSRFDLERATRKRIRNVLFMQKTLPSNLRNRQYLHRLFNETACKNTVFKSAEENADSKALKAFPSR
jgi:hypothetical protein